MNHHDQFQEVIVTPSNGTVEQAIMDHGGVQLVGEESDNDSASEYISFATSLLAECKAKLALANLDTVIFLFRQVLDKRPFAHPLSSVAMNDLVSALILRFIHTGQINDWDEMFDLRIARIQSMLNDPAALTSNVISYDEYEQDTEDAANLAKECLAEVHASISFDELNNVVFFLRTSLDMLCSNEAEPMKLKARTALTDALYTRYHVSNDASDLDEAVSSIKTAFKHIHKYGTQNMLSQPDLEVLEKRMQAMMMERVTLNGDFNFEDRFMDALHTSGKDTREPRNYRYAMSCANIFDRAIASMAQFENGGQRKNLDEAISLHRQALGMRSFPHPYRSESLDRLATAPAIRFNNGAQPSDLEEAISLFKEALNLESFPQLDRGNLLYNIANVLALRYNQGGRKHDLDEAVSKYRQSLELRPITHPLRHWSLINLGNVLLKQSQLSGKSEILDEVVNLQYEAVDLCPSPNPDRPHTLGSLANALWIRFRYGSQRGDLDEAILLFRQSLDLFEQADAHRYATINNFATALVNRFELLGKANDLDDAIFWQKQTVAYFQAMQHPERHPPLNNLSNMLALRYQRGQKSDLDDAISSQRQLLGLRPRPHPERASSLNNLGNLLVTRFSKGQHHDDLGEAIISHREALDLRPPPDSDRYTTLVNLANSISKRFECEGDEDDFHEVVRLHREAIGLLPPEHPKRYASFHNLGKIFRPAYPILDEKKEYLAEAIASFSSGLQCPSLSPSQRLVAKSWALMSIAPR